MLDDEPWVLELSQCFADSIQPRHAADRTDERQEGGHDASVDVVQPVQWLPVLSVQKCFVVALVRGISLESSMVFSGHKLPLSLGKEDVPKAEVAVAMTASLEGVGAAQAPVLAR